MTEENTTPEGDLVETQIRLQSAEEGVNINEAKSLRLTVEGDALLVAAVFELALGFIRMAGGEVDRAQTESGEDITDRFRPAVIDPFDLGDDSVA